MIVVELPKTRSSMHLDTAMTMIDKDKFSVYSELPEELRTFTLTKKDDSGAVRHRRDGVVAGPG